MARREKGATSVLDRNREVVAEYYGREGVEEEREVTEIKARGGRRGLQSPGERARLMSGADTFLIKTVSRRN